MRCPRQDTVGGLIVGPEGVDLQALARSNQYQCQYRCRYWGLYFESGWIEDGDICAPLGSATKFIAPRWGVLGHCRGCWGGDSRPVLVPRSDGGAGTG